MVQEAVHAIYPVNGFAKPVVSGTVIPYKVPNIFDRPWAQIWKEYHEKGMKQPLQKELRSLVSRIFEFKKMPRRH